MEERHFTVKELALTWNLSDDTIIRLFKKEDGVLKWVNPTPGRRYAKVSLRIPASVAERVYRRLTHG